MKSLWTFLVLVILISVSTSAFADINYGLTGNENITTRTLVIGGKGKDPETENVILDKLVLINNKYRIENTSGPEAVFSIKVHYLNQGNYAAYMSCECLQFIESPFSGTIIPSLIWGTRTSMFKRNEFISLKSKILEESESCYEAFLSNYLRKRRTSKDH